MDLCVAVGSVHISPINEYESAVDTWPEADIDETFGFEGKPRCQTQSFLIAICIFMFFVYPRISQGVSNQSVVQLDLIGQISTFQAENMCHKAFRSMVTEELVLML